EVLRRSHAALGANEDLAQRRIATVVEVRRGRADEAERRRVEGAAGADVAARSIADETAFHVTRRTPRLRGFEDLAAARLDRRRRLRWREERLRADEIRRELLSRGFVERLRAKPDHRLLEVRLDRRALAEPAIRRGARDAAR